MTRIWNWLFWLFFAALEFVIIFSLIISMSNRIILIFVMALFLGVWKMAEDVQRLRQKKKRLTVRIREEILDKLR